MASNIKWRPVTNYIMLLMLLMAIRWTALKTYILSSVGWESARGKKLPNNSKSILRMLQLSRDQIEISILAVCITKDEQ